MDATRPGFASRAVAWNGRGWGALVSDGGRVFLREITLSGEGREGRHAVPVPDAPGAHLGLAWLAGGYVASVARPEGESVWLAHADGRGTFSDSPYVVETRLRGEPSLVAGDEGAGLFYVTPEGARLRLVERDGEPGQERRCPSDLEPRNVVAWDDGFRALIPVIDPDTHDTVGLDVASLDDGCSVRWRESLWRGPINGRVQAIAAGEDRVYVAFGDRDGAVWFGVLDGGGDVVLRPRVFLPSAAWPRLFPRDGGVAFLAVRMDESADRVDLYHLDRDGIHQGTRTVTSAPTIDLLFATPDVWGGALVGWRRPEPTRGASSVNPAQFTLMTRACP